jgi:glycosyltransferase involved in cell wall biosynthesis
MSEPDDLPPIAKEPLTVLLLAHNNAPELEGVIRAWLVQLDRLEREYEVILVDDGSTDATGAMAQSLAAGQPRLRVLSHDTPHGPGAALRTGLAAARFPLLLQAPADSQYQPENLKRFLDKIDLVHLVTGYRVSGPVPFWLRWLGRLYRGLVRAVCGQPLEPLPGWLGWSGHSRRLVARALFGVRTQDVDCDFRLFRRSIFARIPIQSDGSFAQLEVLAKANFLGCLMTEEPIPHRPGPSPPAGDRRLYRKEMLRIISRASFGPAVLPVKEPAVKDEAKPENEGSPLAPELKPVGPEEGGPDKPTEATEVPDRMR